MNNLPLSINILFIVTTFLTVWQFYAASGKSKTVLFGLMAWMLFQAIIGLTGFYRGVQSMPPRFILLIGPGILFTIILFITQRGMNFIDRLDIQKLTILHTLRIPVEITLYFVFIAGLIPAIMTFEGNNYDVLSGISAIIIYYFTFVKHFFNKTTLLIWNFICLGLLLNIMILAILAAQTPFQQFAFEQPNIGVTFFPFVWLPAVVVPIVLCAHLAAIRQLILLLRDPNRRSTTL